MTQVFGVFPLDKTDIFLPQEFDTKEEAENYQKWLKEWNGVDSVIEEN